MEFIVGSQKPLPPLSLEDEHKWIEYCRHIPVNSQLLKNEAAALRNLRDIIEKLVQYNNGCGICSGVEFVKFPLELSCVTSKRGRTTLDPVEAIEYINQRLQEIEKE